MDPRYGAGPEQPALEEIVWNAWAIVTAKILFLDRGYKLGGGLGGGSCEKSLHIRTSIGGSRGSDGRTFRPSLVVIDSYSFAREWDPCQYGVFVRLGHARTSHSVAD
jgi:hypothetical protein